VKHVLALVLLVISPLALAEQAPSLGVWWSSAPAETSGDIASYARVEAALGHDTGDANETLAGRRGVVTLTGMPDPGDREAVDAWLVFARGIVRDAGRGLAAVQVGVAIDAGTDLTQYSFVLKATSLAIRAEARAAGRDVAVLQATVPAGRPDLQRSLWKLDVAPYIDVIPLRLGNLNGEALSTDLAAWSVATLEHPPAPRLWVVADDGSLAERAAVCLEALAAGVAVALVEADGADAELQAWVDGTHERISANYAPAPLGSASVVDSTGTGVAGGRALLRLFDSETASTLVFYRAPGTRLESPTDRLLLPDRALRETTLVDLTSGETERIGSSPEGTGRAVRVRRGAYPLAVSFIRPSGPLDLPPEAVETSRTREPTAEEIIAAYRQVQRQQDDLLERYTARGRTDLHFSLTTGGGTIDYSVEANYFWERDGRLEWEETDYFINGNRLGWKKIPEIPLIQPEKVITLPLDLTLDRTYAYRKVGREQVAGRDAWVLAFEPGDPDAPLNLYRGRIWIDTETFVRLQTSLVQTRLEAPVLSNEEIDRYSEILGADGSAFWVLSDVDGQQVWNVGGRSFVVQRELTFTDIRINPPAREFEQQRAAAYDGDNKMLRDTDEGFRYLDRDEDGARVVRTEFDTGRLFLLGGALKDNSTDGVVPLAGVNYLNFDLKGTGLQLNAFLAGLVNFVTLSDPDLGGSIVDGTFNAGVSAIKGADKVFSADSELLLEEMETRGQNVSFSVGVPLGKFAKFNFTAAGSYVEFFESDDQQAALTAFNAAPGNPALELRLPPDHFEYRGTFGVDLNRRGWSLAARATLAGRSEFGEFGLFDQGTGGPVAFDSVSGTYVPTAVEEVREDYRRYSLTAKKEWFLPKFQKLRGEVNLFDGSDLDRFSRWEFTVFGGTRLQGFAGSGVRFDEGAVARLGYSFNVMEAIRFDAALESAWVRDDVSSSGTQNHGGFGVAANFVAPWKLVFSLSYGRALWSDVPELKGQDEFLFVVLRLF
jgi:hypothetical protein